MRKYKIGLDAFKRCIRNLGIYNVVYDFSICHVIWSLIYDHVTMELVISRLFGEAVTLITSVMRYIF